MKAEPEEERRSSAEEESVAAAELSEAEEVEARGDAVVADAGKDASAPAVAAATMGDVDCDSEAADGRAMSDWWKAEAADSGVAR